MTGEPRLTVEIIPTSLHGKNPRTEMGRAMWERQRRKVCEAAGNRCEICGGVGKRHPVEIHERYEYDETSRPPCQKVVGLIALCPDCHAVKHLARTRLVARQQGDRSIYENAVHHLAHVNVWDDQGVRDYLAEVQAQFRRREALGEWTQDFSPLLGDAAWGTASRGLRRRVRSPAPTPARKSNVIDRLREQIQERLDQLIHEADRLRNALAALGPGSSKPPATRPAARDAKATRTPERQPKPAAPPRTKTAARANRRTAPGATKASVLAALAGGEAMTAGEVATKAGLARATVSTTLSKLAKSGEVEKAERGYRLPSPSSMTQSSSGD
jgi:hypothetical protein